ncbi:MAG: diguanylate cyclase [Burkholderiales bacterium]|nr:diguanylate cyclase [Burkholderiales bacterium]
MTIDASDGDASMYAPAGGMEAVDLSSLRFDLLCGVACHMFGVAAATIRVRGTDKVWHAVGPASAAQADASDAGLPAEGGCPLASIPFGDGDAGWFSLFGPSSRAFGASELRQFEQLAALAQEQLRLFDLAQGALRRESGFRLLTEAATDTIVRGNLDGVRLYVSPSVEDLLGYAPEELVGRKAIEVTHPDDAPAFMAMMQEIRAGRLKIGRTELRQRHKNGSWVWIEASIRLTQDRNTGRPDGYVVSVRNIGHRKQLEARLKHLAEVDDLTGLPNRASFFACLDLAIQRARQGGEKFALLYMDLDGFKQVNDTLGHAVGDTVLRETAVRLQASLRDSDRVFRLGGDEFTVLSDGLDGAGAIGLAQRLIAEIAMPFAVDTACISIGLSVGISCGPAHGQQADRLVECADQALYCAKKAGKNTARLYGADMGA